MLASGTKESREAVASTSTIVTKTTTRAISTSLITVAIKRISSRRTLLQITCRASVASVTQTTDVFHGIPRSAVGASNLRRQVLLRPARTTVVTVVRANGTLTSNTIITSETLASTGLSVAKTLVGALSPGVQVILVHNATDPSIILRASTERAIGTSPLWLTIQTEIALTVVI